jgi:aspartyl-tRNA(Asn)/glutamyl-tRNA(Gln) amidotransferase subunit A
MNSFITIKELKDRLESRELSLEEVIEFYRARIEKYNPDLNAVLHKFEWDTRKSADYQDTFLRGIPGLVKSNISELDRITNCGSKFLSKYKSPYDATVINKLKNGGAVLLGKTNMDEFAMGGSGEFSAFGSTKNPWDVDRTPGGSSSGSAAAVAAGLIPWALGTETGGSVRQPASFCGLVGLYPTYGLVSRYGVVAFASSTDQVGVLSRTVYDNAMITSVIAGHDPKDSTSLPEPVRDYTKMLKGKLPKDLTIGVIKDSIESEGVSEEVKISFKSSVSDLEKLGAKIKYISLPDLKYGIAVYFVLNYAEAASNLSRFDGSIYGLRDKDATNLIDMYVNSRHDGFGAEVKRRILVGNYVLSAKHKSELYAKANHIRCAIRAEFEQAFRDVDLLMSPTTPNHAPKLGENVGDPIAMYLADYFNVPNCIAGMPALSVPCGLSKNNMPIGVQFIGPRLSEDLLYQVGHAYEQNTPHHLNVPKGYK